MLFVICITFLLSTSVHVHVSKLSLLVVVTILLNHICVAVNNIKYNQQFNIMTIRVCSLDTAYTSYGCHRSHSCAALQYSRATRWLVVDRSYAL